jgi:hypothetical protein
MDADDLLNVDDFAFGENG